MDEYAGNIENAGHCRRVAVTGASVLPRALSFEENVHEENTRLLLPLASARQLNNEEIS